jgi:predicted TIM-barrel fold metal-dependent hydrolase
MPMLIIDCHAHLYAADPVRYPTLPDPLRPPPGTGTVEHLRAESRAAGVTAVRAIQTRTYYGFDNRYLCDSARAHPDWLCGVVTLDPDEGITIDLFLMQPEMIESAATLLAEFPRLIAGFCHCMDLRPWPDLEQHLQAVLRLSRFPNLYPKVDFIATGTEQPYPCADLHQPCRAIVKAYGAERCLWGSCYPNGLWTPRVSYAEHLRIFTEALPLTDDERRLILGENARRIWFPELQA